MEVISDPNIPVHDHHLVDSEYEDTLSFSDLPIHDLDESDHFPTDKYLYSPSRHNSFFEFGNNLITSESTGLSSKHDIVFCGKIIEYGSRGEDDHPAYLTRSESLTTNRSFRFIRSQCQSTSARFFRSLKPSFSMERNPSNHNVLIGITKVPSEMDLSEMRKRQMRRPPSPIFPSVSGEEVEDADFRDGGKGKRLIRPLRYRSRLINALTKASFACIPLASHRE